MSNAWLRQASMKRLNTLVIDKKEVIGHRLAFCSNINCDDLEPSGLSDAEKLQIRKWFAGDQSGRQCMLALLECHMREKADKSSKGSDKTTHMTCGAPERITEFNILSKSINLPENFLCDSGYMCETVFSKPPNTVLKEALQLMSTYAMEKSSTVLTVEQINLSLKQMRVDTLKSHTSSGNDSDEECGGDDDTANSENVELNRHKSSGRDEERGSKYRADMYRLQVLVELLRLHITRSDGPHTKQRLSANMNSDDEDSIVRPVVSREHPDHRDIETHLGLPLAAVQRESEKLSSDDLDEANRLYQPYINQLMELKATLKAQLQEIDDSRAFMSLGVAKDSSDAAIKKAYHAKAVRLHPDKPGGDKEKFQRLHDMYQDVLKRRREEAAVEAAALRAVDTPESREEMQLVRGLVHHMEACMGDIQRSAAECTQVAQLSVRWQKMIDAASKLPHPRALKKLHKMITADMAVTFPLLVDAGQDAKKGCPATVHNNAATLLLGPIDTISRAMHQVVTSCMQLLKSGERYGSTAGSDMAFMKRIEYCAQCGMQLQQLVPSLYPVENQILMCIDRADRSFDCALEDGDIYSVLVRMINTVFSTRAVTLSSTADHAVTAAMSAVDLILAVKALVKSADEDVLSSARQRAAMAERENDFCAEDLAAMAELRAKEQSAQREVAERKKEEEVRAKEEGKENEYMMGQIQSLQMQLRLQYIEALQTLNAETREMQKRVVAEVGETVKGEVNGSRGHMHGRKAPPPPPPSDMSPEYDKERESASKQSPVLPREQLPLKDSLFSLLAEFVDSSCITLRNDLRELPVAKISTADRTVKPETRNLEGTIEAHLGWMSSLGGGTVQVPRRSDEDGNTVRSEEEAGGMDMTSAGADDDVFADDGIASAADSKADEEKTEPIGHSEPSRRTVKLALLPDYRAKILWLSVMVDSQGVLGLVQNELLHRLRRDCVTAVEGQLDDALVEYLTDKFCGNVLSGIEAAAEELPQTPLT